MEGGAGGGGEGGDVLAADNAARDGARVAAATELVDDEGARRRRRRHHTVSVEQVITDKINPRFSLCAVLVYISRSNKRFADTYKVPMFRKCTGKMSMSKHQKQKNEIDVKLD